MYKKDKPLTLKGSTSALYNNLSFHASGDRGVMTYAVVHKAVVNMVGISNDGFSINHRQVVCKEPTATHGNTIILQAKLVSMPNRTLLVIASQMGIQIFEADTSLLLYWYALGDGKRTDTECCFSRGICGVGDDIICVGDHEGCIRVFDIPRSGTNITLSNTIKGNNSAICDLESDGDRMVSSDEDGGVVVWQAAGDSFRERAHIQPNGVPASSVGLWRDLVIAGFASGHLRIFSAHNGQILAEATAHGRWITAIDVCANGMILTASEDSFVRVWQLKGGSSPDLEHKHAENVTDLQLQGAKFTSDDGRSFAVTGYDSNDLIFYTQN